MNICLINQTERSHIIMQLKLLVMALSAPVALNALATTEPFAFTPEKVSTELSLGTLSGKTKERLYAPEEGGRLLLKAPLTGTCSPVCLLVHQAGLPSVIKGGIWLTVTGWIKTNQTSGQIRAGIPIPALILPTNLI